MQSFIVPSGSHVPAVPALYCAMENISELAPLLHVSWQSELEV